MNGIAYARARERQLPSVWNLKMGIDAAAVVTPELKVIGIEGLRENAISIGLGGAPQRGSKLNCAPIDTLRQASSRRRANSAA